MMADATEPAQEAIEAIDRVSSAMPWLLYSTQPSNVILINQTSPTLSSDEDSSASSADDGRENEQIEERSEQKSSVDYEETVRQRLSTRAYHLPGNNWCEDWQMYIRNNHLVSIFVLTFSAV